MPTQLPTPLRGVITAMITPLLEPDKLDVTGLEKLIDHLIHGGVHALFILGSTGEAPSLSYRTRLEMVQHTCRHTAGRLPVIVGVTDTSFTECVNFANAATDAGVDALVLAMPYYFAASQNELVGYVHRIAAAVRLPIFLYNAPSNVHHVLSLDAVRKMADSPRIAGLKDSGFNMIYFHKLVWLFRDRPDFTLLVGPEELTGEAVLLGGHGGMCGGANIEPKLYVDMYNAAAAGNLPELNRLHSRIMQISSTVYRVAPEDSSYLRGMKCAVSLKGICRDVMAEPYQPFAPAERAQVKQHMISAGLLIS